MSNQESAGLESERLRTRVAKDCCVLYAGAEDVGWECGQGWDRILEKLSYRLEALNVLLYEKWRVKIVAAQVKEKYATLRFYHCCMIDGDDSTREQDVMLQFADDMALEWIRQAGEECFRVCEKCGNPIGTGESPRCWTLGWHRYLCRECVMNGCDGRPVQYEMNGKYYEGARQIPDPFGGKSSIRDMN